ncbi:hypothetical protein [Pseudidiomarina salinarum]|uniref:hypothetical protein n=1 Tax=Pseudidiomarina salinarum TaxID=435908 RepID=UPI0039EEA0EF
MRLMLSVISSMTGGFGSSVRRRLGVSCSRRSAATALRQAWLSLPDKINTRISVCAAGALLSALSTSSASAEPS